MKNLCIKIVKSLWKLLSLMAIALAILATIYFTIDFAFKNILPFMSRAVLSNFIVFALIIYLVMRQVVHPKAMLEVIQTKIETDIKESEVTKIESETKLDAIQKSSRSVKKEINEILKKSEENAQLVGSKILKEAENTALIVQENTEKVIENNITLLKNDLVKRVSLASVEVAKTHIINELNNNQDLHDKFINESIEALIIDKEEKEVQE